MSILDQTIAKADNDVYVVWTGTADYFVQRCIEEIQTNFNDPVADAYAYYADLSSFVTDGYLGACGTRFEKVNTGSEVKLTAVSTPRKIYQNALVVNIDMYLYSANTSLSQLKDITIKGYNSLIIGCMSMMKVVEQLDPNTEYNMYQLFKSATVVSNEQSMRMSVRNAMTRSSEKKYI